MDIKKSSVFSENEDDIVKIAKIANAMREMGSKISTDEIERAIRLYRTAKSFTQYNYFPIFKVLESVFVKRKDDLVRLEKAFLSIEKKRYLGNESVDNSKKKEIEDLMRTYRKGVEKRETAALSWKDVEKLSKKKLKRMKLDTAENIEKLNVYKLVETLWNYYRTGNRGYLEILEDQIIKNSQKRKGEYNSKDGLSIGKRYESIQKAIERLVLNPEDPKALAFLSSEFGERFTIDVIRFLILSGKKSLAELISSRFVSTAVSESKKGRKKKTREKRHKVDLRKTIFLSMRNTYPTPFYVANEKKKGIVLLVDKSDSMRKHYAEAVMLASSLFYNIKRIYLFDEDIKQISIKKWHSKRYLIEELIKAGVSGYTNITKALKKLEATLRPGDHLIIISDMEQTIADESYVTVINRLRKKNVKMTLFTTEKHISQLKHLLDPGVKILNMEFSGSKIFYRYI